MAFNFNGTTHYLRDLSFSNITTYPFSMACWCYRTGSPTYGTIQSLSIGTVLGQYARTQWYNPSSAICANVINGGQSSFIVGSNPGSSVWFHVALVSAASNDHRLFVNGTKYTDTTTVNAMSFTAACMGSLRENSAQIDPLACNIQDAGYWDVALSDGEVAALASGVACPRINLQGLVSWLPMIPNDLGNLNDRVSGRAWAANCGTNITSPVLRYGPRHRTQKTGAAAVASMVPQAMAQYRQRRAA